MERNVFYEQLIKSEPLGFIDPFADLGEFDRFQLKFKSPVRELLNKYSGERYSPQWQKKIEEMRSLYIQYQISIREDDTENTFETKVRKQSDKESFEEDVITYLKLGFRFAEIEKKMNRSAKRLRSQWKRSQYVETHPAVIYNKQDLQAGYAKSKSYLPGSMKLRGEHNEDFL
ncbi:modification methylase Sau96I [Streptococcus anginosus]|uniref:modification methylase Sau96I n=1 Tax=Streptococcus anginosus TaxID=1328 RepID=UPI0021F897D6|nr:modification methylase Sau96I [Streptococcus anginosus]MCW1017553.1 modification methylase Sau96I [Streptococcus anginosus]